MVGGGAWSKVSPPGESAQRSARTPPWQPTQRSARSRRLTCLLGRHVPMRSGDSWRHVNTHGFNSESVHLNVTCLFPQKKTWQFFVPKYLGSSFVQLVISSLSRIEEKTYEVIFVPYHVTMLSVTSLCSLLDFLKFKTQDSKKYHNLHHSINFQAVHLFCCIS